MSKKISVLVVDDDVEDHAMMAEYFESFSIQDKVRYETNGIKGFAYLENVTDDELPDLILLDLNMPLINGTQLLINLKRNVRFKDIPVVIYSTSENETEKRKCLSFGALNYIVKPATYDDGLKMVEKFVSLIR